MEIASAYVSLSADTRQIPKDVRKALGQAEGAASSSGQSIGQKISSGLGKTLKRGALTGGAAAGAALGMSLKKGFDRLSAIEQSEAKLTGLGHSTESVAKIMDNALGSVKGTAYGLGDAASVAAGMVAAGIKPGKELEGVLKTMGDTAAIAGRDLTDVGLIFQSVAAKGKLQGDDMLQLMSSGIPVLQLLGDELGKTSEEVSDMVSNGEIDFATFEKAMKKGMGGAALEAGKTFKGSMDNMGAAMGRLGEIILKGAFNKAPEVIGRVTEGIDFLGGKIKEVQAYVSGDPVRIEEAFGVEGAINVPPIYDTIANTIYKAQDALTKLAGAGELFFTGDFHGGIRKKLGVEEDSKLVDDILNIRDVFVDWGERVGNVFRELADLAKQLAPSFGSIAASLGKATAKVSAATWEALLRIVEALAPVLEKVLVPAFGTLAQTMEDHPKLVEALVFAFGGLKVIKFVLGPIGKLGGTLKGLSSGFKVLKGTLGIGGKGGTNIARAIQGFGKTAGEAAPKGSLLSKSLSGLTKTSGGFAKVGTIFGKFSSGLAKMVAKGGLSKVIGLFGKFALKAVPIVGVLSAVYEALKWFFTKTETGKKVFEGLKNVLSNVWNWIKDKFVTGFEWASEKIGGVWDKVTETWNAAWQKISDFISDSWERLQTVWDTVGQPIVDFIKGAWEKVWYGIRVGANIVKAIFQVLWTAVQKLWENVGQPFVDRVKQGFEALWNGLKTVFEWIGNAWDWLWKGAQTVYNNYIVPVIDWIKGAFETLKGWLSTAWNWIKDQWNNLWQAVKDAYGTYIQPVVDWVVDKFDQMKLMLQKAWWSIKAYWHMLWATVRNYWYQYGQPIVDWIVDRFNWFKDKIGEAFDTVKGFAQGLVDKIREKFNEVVDTVTGVKDRILNAVSDAKDWLVETGKNIVRGLWDGIKSMGSWLKDKLTGWVPDWVTGPFEGVLDINSPSRVFAKYGVFIGQGLANGIESMGKKVEKATQAMADRVAGVEMPDVGVNMSANAEDIGRQRGLLDAARQELSTAFSEDEWSSSSTSQLFGGNVGLGNAAVAAAGALGSASRGDSSGALESAEIAVEEAGAGIDEAVASSINPSIQSADLSMTEFGANVQATATGVVTPQWQGMASNVANAAKGVIAPAFGAVQTGLSNTGARFAQQTSGVMTPMWNSMGTNVQRVQKSVTDPAMAAVRSALSATGAHFTSSVNGTINPVWNAMGTNVQRVWTGTVNPAFNAIAGGLQNTVRAFDQGATGIRNQWNRVRSATAEPVKFAIESVFNQGVVGMWNSATELLGTKKMAPYKNYHFATGGYVRGPGGTTDDKIPAMLSDKEYVVNAKAVKKIGVKNLNAINSGAPIAQQAYKSDLPRLMNTDATWNKIASRYASGGPVKGTRAWTQLKRGWDWARQLNGRPYVLGGDPVGGGGTDCSGYMGSIADRIQGGAGHRSWATMHFNGNGNTQYPSGPQGFKAGLQAGFSIGVKNGGQAGGHTAGTLGPGEGFRATNVESGGSHGNVAFGGPAVGADHSQFPTKFHLPFTSGGFVSGGGGGGAYVSMQALVAEETKKYSDKIAKAVASWNRPGLVNTIPAAVGDKLGGAAQKKIDKLAEELDAVSGAGAGVDISGVSGDVQNQVREVFARRGWTGQKWSDASWIIGKESSWNPTATNPSSGAFGLFQFNPSSGTLQQYLPDRSPNPAKQARAGVRYIEDRYQANPSVARAFWERNGWYDNGGYLQPGVTRVQNDSKKPEPVFSHKQWQILKGNIMSAAQAGDLKKLQINLGVVANGLQQAVAKLDWREIFGAASKAFNDKFFEDQAADVRSVFGIPDPDSIPAVKAYAEFRENEKKLNEKQAQAAKDSREAAVQSNEAADKISAVAPVPVKAKSESVSVGSQVARTGALVSRALANPNPVTVGAAAKSGGDTIQFIVRNEEAAWSEYRKFQAKNSRGRVGAR
ncbi:tape measure protein [Corynebacterium sp.]|uniref:aggregation-promoting factor C-terminal-like domain-containing protein n=1 Tax=Corynebacterium sp. TaxID=1720 RepID=UPI0028AFD8E1|nr:tape measure protein [Corynebacterium sp.]